MIEKEVEGLVLVDHPDQIMPASNEDPQPEERKPDLSSLPLGNPYREGKSMREITTLLAELKAASSPEAIKKLNFEVLIDLFGHAHEIRSIAGDLDYWAEENLAIQDNPNSIEESLGIILRLHQYLDALVCAIKKAL